MIAEKENSQQAQQLLAQAQMYQQQLQAIVTQKEAFNMQFTEIQKALTELSSVKDDVYKAAGPVLIKTDVESVKKELNEKVEFITLRVKTLEKSEKRLKEQFEEISQKLSKITG